MYARTALPLVFSAFLLSSSISRLLMFLEILHWKSKGTARRVTDVEDMLHSLDLEADVTGAMRKLREVGIIKMG